MKKVIFLFFLITFVDGFAIAIYPVSLRVIVDKSHLITYGKVLKIYPTNLQNKYNYNEIAEIETLEILKGQTQTKIIKILYQSGQVCPPHPRFTVNTNVLAFLIYEDGLCFSVSFSSGIKTMQQNEFETYKNRVFEIIEINTITDKNEQNIKIKDWALTCLSDSITKIEGVRELQRKEITNKLNFENKQQIKQLFFSNPKFDYNCDFVFADILKTDYPNEVDQILLKNLLSVDSAEISYVFEDFYSRLEHLGNRELNTQLKKEFDQYIDYEVENVNKMMSIYNAFIKNISN
ncbi:MAG: hypothetical protein IT220_07800 [Flavobacteriaceae bacterium]|nr:hypothetical protein [Flavobacteriaceae bacterium]